MNPAVLVLAVCAAACSSVDWREGGPTDTWRGAVVRCADGAHVAATSESAAADVYWSYVAVRGAIERVCAVAPPEPLLLAVDADDELLLGEAAVTMERLIAWHLDYVTDYSGGIPVNTPHVQSGVPAEVLALAARAVAGAVPLQAAELALPASWQQGMTWGFVMPTESAIEAATDGMIDYGMEQAQLSFVQRMLIAPFMPFMRSMAHDEFRAEIQRQLLQAALAAMRRRGPVPADAHAQCLRELGFEVRGHEAQVVDVEQQQREQEAQMQELKARTPQHEPRR